LYIIHYHLCEELCITLFTPALNTVHFHSAFIFQIEFELVWIFQDT